MGKWDAQPNRHAAISRWERRILAGLLRLLAAMANGRKGTIP